MKNPYLLQHAAALALAMGISTAHAADYQPLIVPEEPVVMEEYQPVEIGSGWYIRGDVGYAFSSSGGASPYRTFTGGVYGNHAWDTTGIKDDWTLSLGFGYHFNDWLRADLTAERFQGRFDGSTSDPFACNNPLDTTTTCASNDWARFTGYSAMANAYVDLGTVVGITPYVGAGAGVTWMRWDSLTNSSFCVDGTAQCGGAGATMTSHAGMHSTRFTWALMAGASYDISSNLKLDVGYRYRKVQGGDMFEFDAASQAAGATGAQGRDTGISSHAINIGLRYELW
ncbi:MAG: porin family protein [Zhengella sp.]|uniref:outer membrane protein n=1 Tax=Zhengella sp. TaxID=2282762 RepID=UPI001DD119CE|nr:porin family protein [Notoacmeibacter sp.]MCC0028117.1 porin family protein [Brucellaceae bacterium]